MVTVKAYKSGMQEALATLQKTDGDKIAALNILYGQLRKTIVKDDLRRFELAEHSIEALRDLILEDYAEDKGYMYDTKKSIWIRKD